MPPLLTLAPLPPPGLVLPTLLDLAKIFGAPVALYLMARFITRRDKTRDDAAAAAARIGQETATERKAWREARLSAEKANADAIAAETRARVLEQLENATDWARVVGILKDFGEVQKLLAVVATTSQHHATEITTLHRRVDENAKHLNEFILRHVQRPA